MDIAGAADQILDVFFSGYGEVCSEALVLGLWEGNDAMPTAFAIMDRDGALAEIEVFDAETEGFHDPQAGAIHDLGGEFPGIFEMGYHGANFGTCHDDGRVALTTGGREVIKSEVLDSKNVFDKKDHGIEGLFLSGRSDVSFKG